MIKQAIKQAWGMLRANPLISTISISGTALSIAMIMVVVLVYQIDLAGYAPETHRNRMLYVSAAQVQAGQGRNRGSFSSEVGKECFYTLQIPEAVTIYTFVNKPISLPGKRLFKEYTIKYTDPAFWKIFDFTFREGRPFSEAEFTSGIPVVVITEQTARELLGTDQAVGQSIIVDFNSYTIVGVVKDVSLTADDAYAKVWMPYTCNPDYLPVYHRFEGMTGPFSTTILAKKSSDFQAIKDELQNNTARYNSTKQEAEITFPNQPFTRLDRAMGSIHFKRVTMKDFLMETGALLLFLLLVPALNLTGVTQSSIQQRKSEIGVRKTFGATFFVLIRQILYENFVITVIGGVIGFFLSFLILLGFKSFLLGEDAMLNTEMLFQPSLFLLALFFTLLLNLLSALIPAIRIAKQSTVDALKGDSTNS